jgi:hypothetical protein
VRKQKSKSYLLSTMNTPYCKQPTTENVCFIAATLYMFTFYRQFSKQYIILNFAGRTRFWQHFWLSPTEHSLRPLNNPIYIIPLGSTKFTGLPLNYCLRCTRQLSIGPPGWTTVLLMARKHVLCFQNFLCLRSKYINFPRSTLLSEVKISLSDSYLIARTDSRTCCM